MDIKVLTKRGKEKFAHKGFLYVFDSTSKDDKELQFWRCEQKNRCKARLHTKAGKVQKELNSHSHEASAVQVQVERLKTNIRKRAAETLDSPTDVVNECMTDISKAGLPNFPKTSALKKIIRRKRNSVNIPTKPADLEETFLQKCQKYVPKNGTEENFLLCDSGQANDRIFIFGRQSWLQYLVVSDTWLTDNSFNIVSNIYFSQIYVILAEIHGGVHPIVYAFLPNNEYTTYVKMFTSLKEKEPNLKPGLIVCDFELAAHSAMKTVFPDVEIKGGFFHLNQHLKNRLTEWGFNNFYCTDIDFALKAKMIISLAYVPITKIDEYLEALASELPVELQGVLNWFEDTFVGREKRRGNNRRTPLFLPKTWNLYERAIQDDGINDLANVAHYRLEYELGIKHPHIWKYIDSLRKIQNESDIYYERLQAGYKPPLKLKKYRDADKRIYETIKDFEKMGPVEYLTGIARNYLY